MYNFVIFLTKSTYKYTRKTAIAIGITINQITEIKATAIKPKAQSSNFKF
jgi:hypothetical protein